MFAVARDIAGDDAPALRQALKQLAVDRSPTTTPGASPQLNGFHAPALSSADLGTDGANGSDGLDSKPIVDAGDALAAAGGDVMGDLDMKDAPPAPAANGDAPTTSAACDVSAPAAPPADGAAAVKQEPDGATT